MCGFFVTGGSDTEISHAWSTFYNFLLLMKLRTAKKRKLLGALLFSETVPTVWSQKSDGLRTMTVKLRSLPCRTSAVLALPLLQYSEVE